MPKLTSKACGHWLSRGPFNHAFHAPTRPTVPDSSAQVGFRLVHSRPAPVRLCAFCRQNRSGTAVENSARSAMGHSTEDVVPGLSYLTSHRRPQFCPVLRHDRSPLRGADIWPSRPRVSSPDPAHLYCGGGCLDSATSGPCLCNARRFTPTPMKR